MHSSLTDPERQRRTASHVAARGGTEPTAIRPTAAADRARDHADARNPTHAARCAPICSSIPPRSARRGATTVDGLAHVPRQPDPQLPRHGPACPSSRRWRGASRRPRCAGRRARAARRRTWCGNGWTGQPAVFERDGRTWVVFGAYDHNVHFVDGETGRAHPPGLPDGRHREGIRRRSIPTATRSSTSARATTTSARSRSTAPEPTELWTLDANEVGPTLWNDDWDGSPLVINDYLLEGGENSRFHIVKLNRGVRRRRARHREPATRCSTPRAGTTSCSTTSAIAHGLDRAVGHGRGRHRVVRELGWTAPGLGRLVRSAPGQATPTRTFRYWLGDDSDASVVADADGFLYVGVEYERGTARVAARSGRW